MRALQLVGWKHAPELVDVSEPEAGPGQVVVKIAAAGACHSDLHLMHDFEPGMLGWEVPFTLGHENAGWVETIGAGVSGLAVGEPVLVYGPWGCGRCARCRVGAENYCERPGTAAGGGLGLDGGMAAKMLVPDARHLVPIGDLDPVLAAPLTDAGLTPYHAIKRSLSLMAPGSVTVVIGIGGLGHMAVQILETLTATTIVAVDPRERALATARSCGAHHTFTPTDDIVAEVDRISRGRSADVVLDFVGADATLALGARLVRSLGHLTVVGIAGGTLPFSFFALPYEAALATTYWGTLPELLEVVSLAEAGRITATVTRYGLADVSAAYDAMAAGQLDGRAVIVPA
jgi:propanol-preferring alcohol dehydrogenase